MHAKHKGHDVMHAEMLIIFLVVLGIAQIVLILFKSRYFKFYQLTSTLGLWLIPLGVAVHKHFWRFLATWTVFSLVSVYIYKLSSQPQIAGSTPRRIYKWFLFLHNLSYVLGVSGYLILMGTVMGVNLVFNIKTSTTLDAGVYLLFYGLYYGVLGRDFAHVCTDRLACKIGYYTTTDFPKKVLENGVCAVCGNNIRRETAELLTNDEEVEEHTSNERIYTLSCNHSFHEFCIRGWVIVGKLQTCPYCKEKVDLKRMFKNPWEKPHLFFGQLLDYVRYLVAWQPLIVVVVQGINYVFGLE